ncbi:MFS transporter [Altererythrobacter salegens]|uniref:MFS transporter n=1 Tax=Croceibacterium salegens TaxID=1737568 RepID=A0A6I4SXU4_9SPHN|nr:MFS transporter [Croceibacterium salegens]MXO59960.1 MFS transporter [Croceibacterium salegens]
MATVPQGVGPTLDADHPLLRPGYGRWVVVTLLLVSIINFADRAVLNVLAQPIKEDLHLTDTDLGLLQGLGFAIFYSVLGIPLGVLAERTVRIRMLATCIAAFSIMTAACGLATNFVTLLLCRIGVGVGEAGTAPVSSSLVADHFDQNRRGSVLGIILLGAPFGFLLGQSVGSLVASEWGWRAAFYAMSVPGLLIAALVFFTLREPPRGLAEGAIAEGTQEAPSFRTVLGYLWAKPTFRQLITGFVLAGFAMNAIANFVLPFYLRGFDVPLATVGVMFGLVSFLSNGTGMLLGGFWFDRLARRDPRWALRAPAICLSLCAPIYAGAFLARDIYLSMSFVFFGNLVLAMHMAQTSATMQNMVGPRMRATTAAVVALIVGILAAGLGPTLAGYLSDVFSENSFAGGVFFTQCPGGRGVDGLGTNLDIACVRASTEGLRLALLSVLPVFAWGAVHYWLASRTLTRDMYRPVPSSGRS